VGRASTFRDYIALTLLALQDSPQQVSRGLPRTRSTLKRRQSNSNCSDEHDHAELVKRILEEARAQIKATTRHNLEERQYSFMLSFFERVQESLRNARAEVQTRLRDLGQVIGPDEPVKRKNVSLRVWFVFRPVGTINNEGLATTGQTGMTSWYFKRTIELITSISLSSRQGRRRGKQACNTALGDL